MQKILSTTTNHVRNRVALFTFTEVNELYALLEVLIKQFDNFKSFGEEATICDGNIRRSISLRRIYIACFHLS